MTIIRYDLEDRTFTFARNVSLFCKIFSASSESSEYRKQAIRASGSVGANYIEANESLGRKDFLMRLRICRKEVKETAYWLRLLLETNDIPEKTEGLGLIAEAVELKKIFSAAIATMSKNLEQNR